MEFRLLYSGVILGASKTNTRAAMKHEIRRQFHPQLRRLWASNFSLTQMARLIGIRAYQRDPSKFPPIAQMSDQEQTATSIERGKNVLAEQWSRNNYKFIPLVTEALCLRCSIDILFLRPDEPYYVIESGDLDARIKTIFDAFRLPKNLEEAGGVGPESDETPFYCLLEDDKLISEIRVDTEQLLTLPKQRDVNPNEAFLVIHVKIKPTREADLNHFFE